MKSHTTLASLWSLSYPLVVAGIGETVIDVTDAMFLARFGITELGAVGLADTILAVVMVSVVGIVEAIQVVIARRAGEDRNKDVGNTFDQGLYVLVILGLVLTLVVKVGAPYLTSVAVSSGDVRAAADGFLQIAAYGIVFESLNLAFGVLLVGLSRTRILAGAAAILAFTNILLDYCLIFGNLGCPRLGIEGAALASLVAEIATCAFMTVYTMTRLDAKGFGLFAFTRWNNGLCKRLLEIAFPVSLAALVEASRWFVFFVIIERLGEGFLASSTIIYSCYAMFLIPSEAISEATSSVVSNVIGQDRTVEIWRVLRNATALSCLVTMPMLLWSLVMPCQLVLLFTPNPDEVGGCVSGVRVIAFAMLAAIPGLVYVSGVCGTGDTKATLGIELAGTVCAVAYAYLAATTFGLPLQYIWVSEIIAWVVCMSLSSLWLRSGLWRRLCI